MAAQWWHMSWPDFNLLTIDDQEFMIAVYNSKNQIDAVQVYESYRKSKHKK